MPRTLPFIAPLVALVGLALGCPTLALADDLPVPTTEQVLLGAPDPAGPTTRGTFLSDPLGQIEHLVAVGHLVAWTVRTPADTSRPAAPTKPQTLPTTTRVVVVDERGGNPLTIDFPGRWISGLTAFRGPNGAADPQIAVRNCAGRKAAGCNVDVLALTPGAPLALVSRTTDARSASAFAGRLDSGQRLILGKRARHGKHRACLPPFSVRPVSGGSTRKLPPLPGNADYPTCDGLLSSFIHGPYVFATVGRFNRDFGAPVTLLYGLDLSAGKQARWRETRETYRSSENSTYEEIGPAVTDDALYLEPVSSDDESVDVWLAQVALPRDVQRAPAVSDPVKSDAISSSTSGACTIAATDDAIYELTSARCSYGAGTAGAINRVVNPEFKPAGS